MGPLEFGAKNKEAGQQRRSQRSAALCEQNKGRWARRCRAGQGGPGRGKEGVNRGLVGRDGVRKPASRVVARGGWGATQRISVANLAVWLDRRDSPARPTSPCVREEGRRPWTGRLLLRRHALLKIQSRIGYTSNRLFPSVLDSENSSSLKNK